MADEDLVWEGEGSNCHHEPLPQEGQKQPLKRPVALPGGDENLKKVGTLPQNHCLFCGLVFLLGARGRGGCGVVAKL